MTHALIIKYLAGEPRAFRLTIPAYFSIKEPWETYKRLATGEWTLADVVTVLRAALIGAGSAPAEAAKVAAIRLTDAVQAASVAEAVMVAAFTDEEPDEPADEPESGKPVTLGAIYKNGFAIGLKPREIDQMTIWEFGRCVAGFNLAHGGEKEKAPDRDEIAAMVARYG